jgi:hypothetical protein
MTITMDFPVVPDGAIRGERTTGKQRNPSARHQPQRRLGKQFHQLQQRLVAPDLQLGYEVRGPLMARAGDTDARGLRIDARLEYYGAGPGQSQEAVLAIVVEVQLSGEADLRWRICPYMGYVSHECRCATDIVILCGNRALAAELAQPVMLGARNSAIYPRAVGPEDIPVITTLADAAADPGRLVLSAWFHTRCAGTDRENLVRLIVEVTELLDEIEPEKAAQYHELALAILPDPSARRLEEMTTPAIHAYVGKKFYPEIWNPALHEGHREERSENILAILASREIAVPVDIRATIVGCRDLQRLGTWFKRAFTASTARDVVADTDSESW